MAEEVITKTVHQYSKPLPYETMEILRGIAEDYSKVKNYVYGRYSGINSLSKLANGYAVQAEMRGCGLRRELGLPVVYYELAETEALADIKKMWTDLKNKINVLVNKNPNLSVDDRIYIHTVMKMDNVFQDILQRKEHIVPNNSQDKGLDLKRLDNLIRRLVRKHKTRSCSDSANTFRLKPTTGYSYSDEGMRIVSRVPRKRLIIPMRDDARFDRIVRVILHEDHIELAVPVDVNVKKHSDYINTIYVSIGYRDMFTLSNGHIYGAGLGERLSPETDRLADKNRQRMKFYMAYRKNLNSGNFKKSENILENNLGKKKYAAQKSRAKSAEEAFINAEINRMLREEKPCRIVVMKRITGHKGDFTSKANEKLGRGHHGFIRQRLGQKCGLNGIELVQLRAAAIRGVCSQCGGDGRVTLNNFICGNCGARMSAALNSARNIEKIYTGQV